MSDLLTNPLPGSPNVRPDISPDQLTPDLLNIDTPEQVSIRFPVAGIGSRFLAILTDSVLQGILYFVLGLILFLIATSAPKTPVGELSSTAEKWLLAAFILFNFLLYWGYFTLFEAFWNGQTPGKRLCKIRVIQQSGRQLTFFESMTRNLIRVIDSLPGFYLVGVISMLCTRRHQRLGDLAASTIVIHERPSDEPLWGGAGARTITAHTLIPDTFTPPPSTQSPFAPPNETLPADAITRLTPEDLAVIERFFSRVLDMDFDTRARLAERLAAQMSEKMQVPPESAIALKDKPERFLESIAHQMRSHGR
ncbi:MAG TPA: RDD family protein [Acidobacteriaceae bacterium]|nr:RDD family protein [Acidobacteriaceae bacterium]